MIVKLLIIILGFAPTHILVLNPATHTMGSMQRLVQQRI
jgi:hypothetical protein